LTTGVTGTLPTANGGTNLTSFTSGGVVYASSSSALATGSGLVFESGSLGVNYSTPSALATLAVKDSGGTGTIAVLSSTASNILYIKNTGTSVDFKYNDNYPITFAINGSERARIDSSGRFGVGTSSPASYGGSAFTKSVNIGSLNTITAGFSDEVTGTFRIAHASGQNILNFDTSALCFQSGGSTPTERARIDSSGRLLLGTTTNTGAGEILCVLQNNNNWMTTFRNSHVSAPYGLQIWYTGSSPNDTTKQFFYCEDTTAKRVEFRSNGGLANYSANNVNLSDRREKTNFAPAKSYLDVICAIPVQTFNYIDQNLETDDGLTLGVVAQDVQAVAPELVMESDWGTKEEPKMRLSIYQTDLQYALMKALQELKAEFDAYKASHP